MGSDRHHDSEAHDNEVPQHTVQLPTYAIGTYPLTVAEYACCVQATHSDEPEDWSDQQQHVDHPVVNVSWHDVDSYARWLTQVTGEQWRRHSMLWLSVYHLLPSPTRRPLYERPPVGSFTLVTREKRTR
jgi:formylglycine-generating enzyme required for sulfatase activity